MIRPVSELKELLVSWTPVLDRADSVAALFLLGIMISVGLILRLALGERRRARSAEGARRLLQEHLDMLTTLTATVGLDGELLLVNRIATHESRLNPEVLGHTRFLEGPWFAYDEAVAARVREHFSKAAQGLSVFFQERVSLARGVIPLVITFTPCFGANGRVSHVLAEGWDLGLERGLEEALRKSQEQLAEAQRLSRLGSWEWDVATDGVEWSAEIYRIFGLTAEEFGNSFEAFLSRVDPSARDEVERRIRECVTTGRELVLDVRIIRKDGSLRVLESRGRLIRNQEGNPIRMIGTCQDITELRASMDEKVRLREREITSREEMLRAEATRKSELFLNSVVENVPDMIFVKDASQLRFVRLNRAAEELLGLKREELLGKGDHDFFPEGEADFFTSKDRAVLESGQLLDIPEETIHTRNRGVRVLHTKKIPILDADGRPLYLLGISEDITDKKRAEEEKAKAHSRVTSLEIERDLRERFVSALSHDLRTPLMTVLTCANLISREPARSDRVAGLARKITESGRRADHMLQDLLDVSRIAAGHPVPLKISRFDLVALTEEIVSEFAVQHADRFNLGCPLPVEGYWCAGSIRRLLENLISNALKYGDAASPIGIEVRRSGSEVELSVRNRGPPISPEELDALFEPFRRSSAAERRGAEGWGLGLALVSGIAHAHGGTVRAHSSQLEGTCFAITLPIDARPTALSEATS